MTDTFEISASSNPSRIYDRDFLLELQYTPYTLRKPSYITSDLPDDLVLKEFSTGDEIGDEATYDTEDISTMEGFGNRTDFHRGSPRNRLRSRPNRGSGRGRGGRGSSSYGHDGILSNHDDLLFPVPIIQDGEEISRQRPERGRRPPRARGRGRDRGRSTNSDRGDQGGYRGSRSQSAQRSQLRTNRERDIDLTSDSTSVRGNGRNSSTAEGGRFRMENDQNKKRERIFGYKRLKELADSDKSADILAFDLLDRYGGFETLLAGKELGPDWMILLLQILSRVLETKQKQTLLDLLNILYSKEFMNRHLTPLLSKLQLNQIQIQNLSQFVHNVFILSKNVLERLPDEFLIQCNLVHMSLKYIVENAKSIDASDQRMQEEIRELETLQDAARAGIEDRKKALEIENENRRKPSSENMPPPDDFREIQILPGLRDLEFNHKPFLRVNKTEGSYDDLNHYLDVQFRLLREDYVRPLRQGILQYRLEREHGKVQKFQDIRLYEKVHIVRPLCTNDGVLHMLQFDVSKMAKVRWESSRRLIFGSLVCLTQDDFETMLFATVTNRDVKELANGFIQVRFQQNLEQVRQIGPSESFIMAETTAYFESYRHILRGLQEIEDDMPFQNYIIKCQSTLKPPKYLRKSVVDYDFGPLIQQDDRKFQMYRPVINTRRWPQASELNLDESQYRALQLAITKELAIIQGPPGTGKTFVGLKIARLLLHNEAIWNNNESNPILVVCYTNHALDQFLEGILDFCDSIVRIGGRCNSQKLEPYILKNCRRSARQSLPHSTSSSIQKRKYDCRKQMAVEKRKIDETSGKLHGSRLGIMYEGTLHKHMNADHYGSLLQPDIIECRSYIVEWLGLNTDSKLSSSAELQETDMLERDPLFATWKQAVLGCKFEMNAEEAKQISDPWMMPLESRMKIYKLWRNIVEEKIQKMLSEMKKRLVSTRISNMEIRSQIQQCENILAYSDDYILRDDQLLTYLPGNFRQIILRMKNDQPLLLYRRINQTVIEQWLCLDGTEESREQIKKALRTMQVDDDEFIDVDEEGTTEEKERIIDEENDDDDDDVFTKEMKKAGSSVEVDLEDLAMVAFTKTDKTVTESNHDGWTTVQSKEKQKKQMKKILFGSDTFTDAEMNHIDDVWSLSFDERAKLYRSWLHKYQTALKKSIEDTELRYSNACESYREVMNMEDAELIKGTKVVAMTTTGAAKFRMILQTIKPRIIIVEEAAEVLESHIITTLNPCCDHLILIGDHKQLRPNPTVYHLAKTYNLDLSLFERMVRNNINFETLELQHRMRPEISGLMQHIYPGLRDHPSVLQHNNILGLDDNIFFITHRQQESFMEETKSRSNIHEAKFTAALCQYFLNQEYLPTQITILTTYSGQLFQLKKLMPKSVFQGVRVTAVDNFQGEENDIIILSLVRSNSEDSIGFLSIENRVCVALSRARKGFYIIGNIDVLAANSNLWAKMEETLKERQAIGPKLWLRCQNHRDVKTSVSSDADFSKCREGGCDNWCETKLLCGHACKKKCHIIDRDHRYYKCTEICGKEVCKYKHKCRRKCFQNCGECTEWVDKIHPVCNHSQKMMCHQNPFLVECISKCPKLLPCGHECQGKCGTCRKDGKHTECKELCERQWPCGHAIQAQCFQTPDKYPCPMKCDALLDCGHKCKGTCNDCFEGCIHVPCQEKCKKSLLCGHICNQECGKPCPPCAKKCQNKCQHSKCKDKCGLPCKGCEQKCNYQCEHETCSKVCHELCDRLPCMHPCSKELKCKHKCMGICGEICPSVCYICNESNARDIYPFCNENTTFVVLEDCGHVFESTSLDQWILEGDICSLNSYVELLQCPKCQRSITNGQRYGRVIKTLKGYVEKIKKKVCLDESNKSQKRLEIIKQLQTKKSLEQTTIDRILLLLEDKDTTLETFTTIENQVILTEWVSDLKGLLNDSSFQSTSDIANAKKVRLKLDRLQTWIFETKIKPKKTERFQSAQRRYFTKLELKEVVFEILRLEYMTEFLVKMQAQSDNFWNDPFVKEVTTGILRKLKDRRPFDDRKERMIRNDIFRMKMLQTLSGFPIQCPIKRMLVHDLEFTKGKWCKCSCGKIFGFRDNNLTQVSTARCTGCKQTIEICSINDRPYDIKAAASDDSLAVKADSTKPKLLWESVEINDNKEISPNSFAKKKSNIPNETGSVFRGKRDKTFVKRNIQLNNLKGNNDEPNTSDTQTDKDQTKRTYQWETVTPNVGDDFSRGKGATVPIPNISSRNDDAKPKRDFQWETATTSNIGDNFSREIDATAAMLNISSRNDDSKTRRDLQLEGITVPNVDDRYSRSKVATVNVPNISPRNDDTKNRDFQLSNPSSANVGERFSRDKDSTSIVSNTGMSSRSETKTRDLHWETVVTSNDNLAIGDVSLVAEETSTELKLHLEELSVKDARNTSESLSSGDNSTKHKLRHEIVAETDDKQTPDNYLAENRTTMKSARNPNINPTTILLRCKNGHAFNLDTDAARDIGYRCPDCNSYLVPPRRSVLDRIRNALSSDTKETNENQSSGTLTATRMMISEKLSSLQKTPESVPSHKSSNSLQNANKDISTTADLSKERKESGQKKPVNMWYRCPNGHLYNKIRGEPDVDGCPKCGDNKGKELI